jgi:hypothetical protein
MGFFACLVVLDVIIIFLNLFVALTSKVTIEEQNLFGLIATICVPFYFPLHIVILTQLLDLFKEEVLRRTPKSTVNTHNNNNTANTTSGNTGSKETLVKI